MHRRACFACWLIVAAVQLQGAFALRSAGAALAPRPVCAPLARTRPGRAPAHAAAAVRALRGGVSMSASPLVSCEWLKDNLDKVKVLEKEGKVVQVIVSGFNRGGVTCDLEGLRGFIPRSQLQDGENHQELVGKTLGVAFLEVNSGTRKLVLSEKRASVAARFQELEVGQLVEGLVASVKPYGLFVDLGGISGLLHQSAITNGSLRSIREVFDQDDRVSALITDLDPGRGRIGLNTALLEGPPGELLIDKDKVMAEASDRASRAKNTLKQNEQSAG